MPKLLNYILYKLMCRSAQALGWFLFWSLIGLAPSSIPFFLIGFLTITYLFDGLLGKSVIIYDDDMLRLRFDNYQESIEKLDVYIKELEDQPADYPNRDENLEKADVIKKELQGAQEIILQYFKQKEET
jgi:hypothetical protein